jgi:predicted homoserine dehydrogenase-like protein
VCEVITVAKRDLKKGEILDGIGGFTCYGLLENSMVRRSDNLLPMGLSGGCRMKKDLKKDEAISVTDIEMPGNRMCDTLWREQDEKFFTGKTGK